MENPNHYKKCRGACQRVLKLTGTNWLGRNGQPITEYNLTPGELVSPICKKCSQKQSRPPAHKTGSDKP